MASSTHSAAILDAVASDLRVDKRGTPSPGPGEVLVRNRAIGVNPVDWKRQALGYMIPSYPMVLGADISGTIAAVGPSVTKFKPGDRVTAFSSSFSSGNDDHAAFQEYSIIDADMAAALPENVNFAQGATLPTAIATSTMALFDVLGIPLPSLDSSNSNESDKKKPIILIWGGASSVGSMLIQLARLSGLTVFATASPRHHAHLASLGASVLVDYASPTAVEDLVDAAAKCSPAEGDNDGDGGRITLAVDAISSVETLDKVMQVMRPSGAVVSEKDKNNKKNNLVITLQWPKDLEICEGIRTQHVKGNQVGTVRRDLGVWLCRDALPAWLERGEVVPQKYRVVEGGIGGLQEAMNVSKAGVSGEKVVVEV